MFTFNKKLCLLKWYLNLSCCYNEPDKAIYNVLLHRGEAEPIITILTSASNNIQTNYKIVIK